MLVYIFISKIFIITVLTLISWNISLNIQFLKYKIQQYSNGYIWNDWEIINVIGGSQRVSLMVVFAFLPQNFEKVVGTYAL